jgi:hypothetical protein
LDFQGHVTKKDDRALDKIRENKHSKTEKTRKLFEFQIKFCEDKKSCFCDVNKSYFSPFAPDLSEYPGEESLEIPPRQV